MNQFLARWLPVSLRERLMQNAALRQVVGNTGWLVMDRLFRMGVGLIVGVWVARYLGPSQYGLMNYAAAFVAIFASIANLGLDSIVVRDLVREPAAKDEILGTTFLLRLAGGGAAAAVAIGAIALSHPQDSLLIALGAIIALGTVFQAFDTFDLWFQSQVQSKYPVMAKSSAFVLFSVLKVIAIWASAPLLAFVALGLCEIALGALGLYWAYRWRGHRSKGWQLSLARAKAMLKESKFAILSSLSIIVYMKSDQLMLGMMEGSDSVGLYSAAVRLSEVWYFIPVAIVSSVFPSIISLREQSEEWYYQRLQRLFNLMTRLGVAIALPMTFLAGPIVSRLFGSEYAAAGPVLAIHIWAAVFVFLGVAQGPWNHAEGLLHLSFKRTLLGAGLNILLNLLLIPLFSIVGAAIATIVAQAIATCFSNLFNAKTRPIFRMQLKSLLLVKP